MTNNKDIISNNNENKSEKTKCDIKSKKSNIKYTPILFLHPEKIAIYIKNQNETNMQKQQDKLLYLNNLNIEAMNLIQNKIKN